MGQVIHFSGQQNKVLTLLKTTIGTFMGFLISYLHISPHWKRVGAKWGNLAHWGH